MKKFLCATLLASAAILTSVKAETLPAPVFGLVKQAILDESDAFKSILQQMEAKRAEVQKEMTKLETELKAQEQKLTEEQKKLSEKDFLQKRQAFEKRVREAQEKIEIRRAQMELAAEESKKKVYASFLKVADEVKKETGANILIYKETVITADRAFDLSSQVLAKLNKVLPKVKVTFKSEADVKRELQKMAGPRS